MIYLHKLKWKAKTSMGMWIMSNCCWFYLKFFVLHFTILKRCIRSKKMRLFKLEKHQRYISNEKKIYICQIKNMGTSMPTDVIIFIQSTNSNENMKKLIRIEWLRKYQTKTSIFLVLLVLFKTNRINNQFSKFYNL